MIFNSQEQPVQPNQVAPIFNEQTPQGNDLFLQKHEAVLQKPGTESPTGVDTFLGFVNFISLLAIPFSYIKSPGNEMTFLAIHLIIVCIRLCSSKSLKFYANKKNPEQVQKYHFEMINKKPILEYHAEAYHYEEDGEGNKKKKVTAAYQERLDIKFSNDMTPNITNIFQANKYIIRVDSSFDYLCSDDTTRNQWHDLKQRVYKKMKDRDTNVDEKDTSRIEGMISNILVLQQQKNICLQQYMAILVYFLGFSLFFDRIFYSLTAGVNLPITKHIYSSQQNIPQNVQQMIPQQQNFQPMQTPQYEQPVQQFQQPIMSPPAYIDPNFQQQQQFQQFNQPVFSPQQNMPMPMPMPMPNNNMGYQQQSYQMPQSPEQTFLPENQQFQQPFTQQNENKI